MATQVFFLTATSRLAFTGIVIIVSSNRLACSISMTSCTCSEFLFSPGMGGMVTSPLRFHIYGGSPGS